MKNDILKLSVSSNVFDQMRDDFDKVLKKTLVNMQNKESDEATLTLKLCISLTGVDVPDFDSADPLAVKTIHKPSFEHKISSVMQIKTEESGRFKGEYELVWDEEEQDFVMKPIDNGQRSMFDEDFVANVNDDTEEKGRMLLCDGTSMMEDCDYVPDIDDDEEEYDDFEEDFDE